MENKIIPSVTIITAVKNGERFLEKTINTIINQKLVDLEYIIIDGNSSDNTCKIVETYKNNITYFISEEDNGISHAFNKALKIASGEFINFQGDGDGFTYDRAIYDLFQDVDINKFDIVCGRINRISCDEKIIFTSPYLKNFNKRDLLFKMNLPHQGLFMKKDLFSKFGLFDEKCKYAMDYDYLLRMYNNFPRVTFKNKIISNWREDGLGNNKEFEILEEYNYIKKNNKVAPEFFLKIIHEWSKFKLIIKKKLNL